MGKKLTIAAVQFKWKMEDYKDKLTFQNRIESIMEDIRSRANNSLPLLVAFPEDIGTPMLLFNTYDSIKDKKVFSEAVKSLISSNLHMTLFYKLKFGVSFIRALILSKSIQMEQDYKIIFSSAAKKYNAYIAAGSITLADVIAAGKPHIKKRDVYNICYFFGPEGGIIGSQKKVYLVDFEGKAGFDLSNGLTNDLEVFSTPFGRVGIAICLDGFKEDIWGALHDGSADILIQPSANNMPWDEKEQRDWLTGSYLASYGTKKFKYAVNPMMNGSILDLSFEGQSSIISSRDTGFRMNYSLLEPVEGFVKMAGHHNTEEILISEIEI